MKKFMFIISLGMSAYTFSAAHIDISQESINEDSIWFEAIKLNESELVEVLLSTQPDINLKDTDGNTALHIAIINKHKNLVELLLKNGANLEALNSEGKTPLDLARGSEDLEIIQILNAKHESAKGGSQKVLILNALHQLGKKRKINNTELAEEEKNSYETREIEEGSVEKRHKGDKKAFKCDQCDYACRNKSGLTRHKLIHTGKKPHKCDKCDYAYTTKSNLIIHKRIHTGEKPFKCDQCEFACRSKGDLAKHKVIHSREKRFKCDQCDYASSHRQSLTRHKIIHTGEKPFKCDQCDYACKRKSNLTLHKLIHNSEKLLVDRGQRKEDAAHTRRKQINEILIKGFSTHQTGIIESYLSDEISEYADYIKNSGDIVENIPLKCDKCQYSGIDKASLACHKLTHTSSNLKHTASNLKDVSKRRFIINQLLAKLLPIPQVVIVDSYLLDEYHSVPTTYATQTQIYRIVPSRRQPKKINATLHNPLLITAKYITQKEEVIKALSNLGKKRKIDKQEPTVIEKDTHLTQEVEDSIGKKHKSNENTGLNELLFECDQCSYASDWIDNLNRHKLIHREKTFKCDRCAYACIDKQYLTRHKLKHLWVESFSCDKCDFDCWQKKDLTDHKLTHELMHATKVPFNMRRIQINELVVKAFEEYPMYITSIIDSYLSDEYETK